MNKIFIEYYISMIIVFCTTLGLIYAAQQMTERDEGLRSACEILGGVYFYNHTCLQGKNLFVSK